jgi:gamma-glutamylputrescine oxidase
MTSLTPWAEASAGAVLRYAPLGATITADACIVGGGLTGLSAAIALARGGASVVLVEAEHLGAAASGRNGGQLIPGFRHGAGELIRRFGQNRAERLHGLTLDARERTLALATRHPIDLKTTGHLTAASHASDLGWMADEVRAMAAIGHGDAELVDRAGIAAFVGADGYHGGIVDRLGGHVHPMKLIHALATEATALGVRIHEGSAALAIDPGAMPVVTTAAAAVRARDMIIACDAFADSLSIAGRRPRFARRLMPVWSYSIATAPLAPDVAARLLPGDMAVSDTRFALDYYRLSADRRLLFSGGERYTMRPLADIERFVRRHLARVFPALADVAIDHRWAGRVAVTTTRFPQLGRERGLWFAHGYSGHGLLLAQAAGAAIGQAILGDSDDYDLLAVLPTHDWPGGRMLRNPLYTAAMLWFAMRDRL